MSLDPTPDLPGVRTDAGALAEVTWANHRVTRSLERVRGSLGALREQVAVRVDWKTYVRRRPFLCLGGAFFLGFLLGNRRSRGP